jgi:ubiquinone/menaquinone biosynthesis C-methylase UbiE
MGWYSKRVLPRLMDAAMDTRHTRLIRARVAAGLAGEVLEVGFGGGHNLAHLPPDVTRLLAVEPSRAAIRMADARIAASGVPVEVIGPDAQRLGLPDASVDAALCTWSLCSIPDPVAAVREVRRVLRVDGRLHFVEHGVAPDEGVRRWQARLNPLQQRLVGGCSLVRDIPAILRAGGMTITHLDTYYGLGEPKALAAMYEGRALAA